MMVQGNVAVAGGGVPTGRSLFPADRCSWQQADSADGIGYRITTARFYGSTGNAITLTGAVLGFIGKSGRFVAITDAS